jgi:acetolactate synthase-1/2/3 large subunit
MRQSTGADILCRQLELLGVTHIFGLPGTQNVALFEALRNSSIRTLVATSELAAGFMANGYYRASGKPGVLTTIPGPGVTYTVPAIAEAAHDSAAVLYIAGEALARGRTFDFQAIDQVAILRPLVKRIFEVKKVDDLAIAVAEAYAATTADEPGPVLLQVPDQVMRDAGVDTVKAFQSAPAFVDEAAICEAIRCLRKSKRVAILAGQGANAAGALLTQLAELLPAPVFANRSARGIIPEDHPLSLMFGGPSGGINANCLLDASDLVMVIGCKLTHNGTYGFQLRLDPEKLIRIDSSADVLKSNYPARVSVHADASMFLSKAVSELGSGRRPVGTWTSTELADFKFLARSDGGGVEPEILGVEPPTQTRFFSALREAMPRDSCMVTDTGLHQTLTSRHFQVFSARGLMTPSDFQSMGFGLPAAIGAKLAMPDRPVVSLIGDGGFAMSGMELLTAVREKIPLCVIVFKDCALGQIRLQQMSSFGHIHGTTLQTPNLQLFAQSIGARYMNVRGDFVENLAKAIIDDQVTLIEVELSDSEQMRMAQVKGLVRHTVRQLVRPAAIGWIKEKLRADKH